MFVLTGRENKRLPSNDRGTSQNVGGRKGRVEGVSEVGSRKTRAGVHHTRHRAQRE